MFILFFLVFTEFFHAQQHEIDSLKQELFNEQHDTSRVNQLNRLGYLYYTSKPDTTAILVKEAIDLARKNGFDRGEARALTVLGHAYYVTDSNPQAMELYLKSLKIYEDIENVEGIGNSMISIANIYGSMENLNQSLDYYFKGLKIYRKTGNKTGETIALLNIGNSYLSHQKLDLARSYSLRAYDLAMGGTDQRILRSATNLLGVIYDELEQPGMAMEFYKNAFDQGGISILTSESALNIAGIFKERQYQDSSLYYAKYAFDVAEKGNFTTSILAASSFLAEYYKGSKQLDSAYFYQSISLAAKDSLFDQAKRNKFQALALEETARQQKIESTFIEMEKKKKLNLQYLGITATIVGFILLFLLLSRSIIIGEKWLSFLGIFILLLVFEFINLYFAPIISEATDYSPVLTLGVMVGVAAMLVPLHHKIEKYITKKMIKKNKEIKLAAAKKTIERLEKKE